MSKSWWMAGFKLTLTPKIEVWDDSSDASVASLSKSIPKPPPPPELINITNLVNPSGMYGVYRLFRILWGDGAIRPDVAKSVGKGVATELDHIWRTEYIGQIERYMSIAVQLGPDQLNRE